MLGMSFATCVGIIDWLLSSTLHVLISRYAMNWSKRSSKNETQSHKGIQHGDIINKVWLNLLLYYITSGLVLRQQ